MRIYVAGPYSAKDIDDVYVHIAVARATAAGLWMAGHEAYARVRARIEREMHRGPRS